MSKVAFSQSGDIIKFKKISATSGNFNGLTNGLQNFGYSCINIGDIDKNGVTDLVIGFLDNNSLNGNLFVLFRNINNDIISYTMIGPNIGGLNGTFGNMEDFGKTIANIGDIDRDGINDIVVSNISGGGSNKGEVFVIKLTINGTVKSYTKINQTQIPIINNDYFGWSLTSINDLDKDGIKEFIATATANTDGGSYSGICYLCYIDSNGQLKKYSKISSKSGNFNALVSGGFATTVSSLGDLNRDGNEDIVVASLNPNSLWLLFLDSIGSVKTYQQIGKGIGGYTDSIKITEQFNRAITNLGDIDGDGNIDLAVSSPLDSSNSLQTGRVRILFLNQNGTVKSIKRIDNNATNFSGILKDGDYFGSSLSGGFDLDGDFKNDVIIAASSTSDGGLYKGAIYLLSLDGAVHPTPPKALWRVNATTGNQNTVFNFTQYSAGFPSAYKWSITPNTFTYQSGTSDTSANPIIKFNQTANYSVQLKATNPFSSDSLLRSSYISVQKVGVNNLTKNNSAIIIYPNPTNGLVQIQSPIKIQSILVFDITGKQLLQQQPDTQTDEINISNLPQGLYQIHVQTEMGVMVKKLIKE